MQEFSSNLGLRLWNVVKFVGRAIAVVLAFPFLVTVWLIPPSWWRNIIRLGAALLVYRFIWPRRDLFRDISPLLLKVPYYATHIREEVLISAHWIHDQTNTAVVALVLSLATFISTQVAKSKKERKALKEKLDKRKPEVTARFALSDDQGWICTLLNLGAGTALSVAFKFYVYDLKPDRFPTKDDEFWVDGREVPYLPVDEDHGFYLHKQVQFPYLLPNARGPKQIPLGILPLDRAHEIRVQIEFDDTLDQHHFQESPGGQSRDGSIMSITRWTKRVEAHMRSRSWLSTATAYFGFQLSRVVYRYDSVTVPRVEADVRLVSQKIDNWFKMKGENSKSGSSGDAAT